ncbi:MAG TPA: tripartite tricarboxylate transporter substrate binding protein, partial [Xanthobacteraceae bacterium]
MRQGFRAALLAGLAVMLSIFAGSPAQAQGRYPEQPIRFFIQASPGGLPDTVGRIVARRLQERLGGTIVVENRPGANGGVAAAALTMAPADGYTFLVTDGSVVSINPVLYDKIPYNPNDLLPVVLLARAPLFLAAHPQVPVKTMQEFITYVRANPGKLNYGSSGVGSTHHLSMEAIRAALKLDMIHVPFKGTGESVPALLGGHVDVLFSAYPSLSGAIATHRVTLLATNGAKRSPMAPDAPPVADFIPGFDFAPIIGLFARSGTPQAIVDKMAAEAIATVKEPEVTSQ